MSENVRFSGRFPWSKFKRLAAQLLADDELTDVEIGKKCKVDARTLFRWKQHPEFRAEVVRLHQVMGAVALRYALARQARRLQAMTERWLKLLRVIKARAKAPEMKKAPGGKTGLLVRTVKMIGRGDKTKEVEEFTLDAALLRELRELERHAAQELGQWGESAVLQRLAARVKAMTDDELAAYLGPDGDKNLGGQERRLLARR
jgi:hypothetical protein